MKGYGEKCDQRKQTKINALQKVVPSNTHAIKMGDEKNSKHVFLSSGEMGSVELEP
jgi:hypothetical protein